MLFERLQIRSERVQIAVATLQMEVEFGYTGVKLLQMEVESL